MPLALLLSLSAFALPTEVADAVAMGNCGAVRAALPSPATDAERLARGWCERNTDPETAVTVLEAVGAGVLGEYGRFIRGETLIGVGRPAEAVAALAGLSLPGSAGLQVRIARARALIESGSPLEARDDLRLLLQTSVDDEARFWLAWGGEKRGATEAAVATYQRTWADAVRGPWSARSAERLAALGSPVPDYATPAGRGLANDRVKALTKANRHAESLDILMAIRAAEGKTGVDLALAKAHFRARKYVEAVEIYRKVLGAPEVAVGSSTGLFDYALGTSRTGDYDTAAVLYARLVAQHPASSNGDTASYKLGYLEYDRQDCDAAVPLFRAHLERYPATGQLESTLWFMGRCLWQAGDRDGAKEVWGRLVREKPSSKLAPGVAYWTARAAGMAGDTQAEKGGLAEVIRRYPGSAHAWYASAIQGERFPAKAVVERPAWPASLAARSEVQRAEALMAAGFRAFARDELAPIEAAAKASGKAGRLAAAHAFIATGAYKTGKRLARADCVSPWKGGDPVAQQACYPRPEASIVEPVAERWQIPPLLPNAIMVVESAMDPTVTSIAGARGLMQLMPREGARLHEEAFGRTDFDPDDLYRAPYNAAMGTTELGTKKQELGDVLTVDSLPAVIASYNGGLEAVRRWVDEAGGAPVPFDQFAEDISYTETRRYVRSVLGHLMIYRWVYGDPE